MLSKKYGSDVIVDWLIELGIEFIAMNPGASFRGIHDSLANGSQKNKPKIITCLHEEIAVAVAHGYAKAKGKPMAVLVHNIVGLQHASMAIFNAWCDRVPILLIGGAGPMDAVKRRPWIDWIHTALVQGNQVRDYVKWDDQPHSLGATAESLARGYRLAITEPAGPVYICIDVEIQENEVSANFEATSIKPYINVKQPAVLYEDIINIAKQLIEADFPIICTDYIGQSPEAFNHLVELAETLFIPVIDLGSRHNFPNKHLFCATRYKEEALKKADLILSLDVEDLHTLNKNLSNKKIIEISPKQLGARSFAANYQQLVPADISIVGSAIEAMPLLAREAKTLIKAEQHKLKEKFAMRREWCENQKLNSELKDVNILNNPCDQNSSCISIPAMAAILANSLKHEDFIIANGNLKDWAKNLVNLNKSLQMLGNEGGGGLGYGLGASIGAAFAYRDENKIIVDLQSDGDFLFTPEALWTASHYNLPILFFLDNNRAYGNSLNHAQLIASQRGYANPDTEIGILIRNPDVDFALLAKSFGVKSEGPINDAGDLIIALRKAINYIKEHKKPVLLDIITELVGRKK